MQKISKASKLIALALGWTAGVYGAEVQVTADRPARLYPVVSNAVVTVTVKDAGGALVKSGAVKVRASNDDGCETLLETTRDLSAGNPFTLAVGMKEPGFAYVDAVYEGAHGAAVLGFDAERVQVKAQEPADFETWWQAQFTAQAQIKDAVTLRPIADPSWDARFNYHQLKIRTIADEGVLWGFLGVPKKMPKGKVGCITVVQCAGVGYLAPEANFIRGDMMTLTLNVHPWDPMMKDFRAFYKRQCEASPHQAYMYRGCESRERTYFRNAVLGCKAAVDYVLARPDFDGELFYLGTSQGGGFGLILGGIYGARFRALCIGVPAMCDLFGRDYGRHDGWPGFGAFTKSREMAYYDGINWAKRIKSPVHFTIGMMDRTCPATGTMAAYNAIPRGVPKALLIDPLWGHGTSWSTLYLGYQFLQDFMDPAFRPAYTRY